jgi:hypothetical protein
VGLLKPFVTRLLSLRLQTFLLTKPAVFSVFLAFLVRMSTMYTTERCFFAFYDFSVPAFVDFAAAMSADINARLDGDGD